MERLLESIGALDSRRLVELLVNSRQSCNINDGIPAHVLPDFGDDIDSAEILRFCHKRNTFKTEQSNQVIDDTAIGAKEIGHQAAYNDGRNKMRKV